MPVLTDIEAATFAPRVRDDNPRLIRAQIVYVQSIMEGSRGANRPLDLTEFTEELSVGDHHQHTFLHYLPVALAPAPVVKARVAHRENRYHRPSGVSDWQDLSEDQWQINSHGRLDILPGGYQGPFAGGRIAGFNELCITYWSGFDFTVDSREVLELKAIAGKILSYIYSPQFGGVKRNRVDREMEQEYHMSGSVGEIPASLLVGLKKYAPVV